MVRSSGSTSLAKRLLRLLWPLRPRGGRPDDVGPFDPAFYRENNPDLSGLSDIQLRDHYRRSPGQLGTFKAFLAEFAEEGRSIPSDFDPVLYRRLNPDVDRACSSDLDAYRHYVRHGAAEGRSYRITQDFASLPVIDRGKGKADTDASLARLLASHGFSAAVHWLDAFDTREFALMNFRWAPGLRSRDEAIRLFLEEGIDRLAPIGRTDRFDLAFFRELHPELGGEPDAAVYRHWLAGDGDRAHERSPEAWLGHYGLALAAYPKDFDWRLFAPLADPAMDFERPDARWRTLAHLAGCPAIVDRHPAQPLGQLGLGLAEIALRQRDAATALRLFERSNMESRSAAALMGAARSCELAAEWRQAASLFDAVCAMVGPTLAMRLRQADAELHAGNPASAADALVREGAAWANTGRWRHTMAKAVEAFFTQASSAALRFIKAGNRDAADIAVTECVRRIEGWYDRATAAAPVPASVRRILILTITEPPQCVHYRVEQKIEYLGLVGCHCQSFAIDDADMFAAALPGAIAAVFYRLPATPPVIRAMVAARKMGIRCYYDIDDLLFDSSRYPDPFETFEGAIDRSLYEQLQLFTPLHRAAMSMCDVAIASTPVLADAMRPVVRSGTAILLRNGLDSRLLDATRTLRPTSTRNSPLRLFYGSATLSHNKDANYVLRAVVLPLLRTRRDVTLIIAGFLDLDPVFEEVSEQIVRTGPITAVRAYWQLLSTCDINLAILSPSAMNDCKSEIKWLEAAALAVPSVVSATATLRDVIDHGCTGMLAETIDDFRAGIVALLDDPDRRIAMGRNAERRARQSYDPALLSARFAEQLQLPKDGIPARSRARALLVNVFYPPQAVGGATRIVAEQVAAMKRPPLADRWDVAVAATDDGNPSAHERSFAMVNGTPVYRIAAPLDALADWQAKDDEMGRWFDDVIASFQPDIVHFHCIQRLTTSIIDACEEAGIPWMVSVHDGWWISDYQFLFDEMGRSREPDDRERGLRPGLTYTQSLTRRFDLQRTLRHAAVVTVPSNAFRSLYERAGIRTVMVANGVGELDPPPRRARSTGRVRLAHVGDAAAHKGADLVEAALRAGKFDRLELTMLSYGHDASYEARHLWGTTPVTILGRLPQEAMSSLYAQTDVLLAPSACVESFGLVTREANAAGAWVIAGDRGAIGEDVIEGVDGFVIDVSSPAALFHILTRINDDPSRFRTGVQPRPVRSPHDQVTDFVALYHELIADRRTGNRDECGQAL